MTNQNAFSDLRLRERAIAAVILTSAVLVFFLFSVAHARSQLSDFAAHWTACRTFRSNPYDIAAATRMQEHLAARKVNIQIMANPPWTALLFFLYSALPYAYATALWVLTTAAILWWISLYFWRAFGQKDNTAALAITFCFAPTIFLMAVAQIDVVLLLAMMLFLIGTSRSNWVLAGIGLALFSVKPHFMAIPALYIFLWSAKNRHWRFIVSALLVLGTWIAVAVLLNHAILSQWLKFLSAHLSFGESLPTLSNLLGTLHPWLRYFPFLCGAAYAVYRSLQVSKPNWYFELPVMAAIGLATSFYGYYHDQVLALPLLLYSFAFGNKRTFLVLFCTVNFLIFAHMEFFQNVRMFPVWTAAAWPLISLASVNKRLAQPRKLYDAPPL